MEPIYAAHALLSPNITDKQRKSLSNKKFVFLVKVSGQGFIPNFILMFTETCLGQEPKIKIYLF